MVCGHRGWHKRRFLSEGETPWLFDGEASYYDGFPAVFTAAMDTGSIANSGVSAWPNSFGGGVTIILVTPIYSIEHAVAIY